MIETVICKRISLFIAVLACSSLFFGGTALSQGTLQLSLDVAQFQDAEGQPYLEIYYAFPERALTYEEGDGGKSRSQIVMNLLIFQDDSLWASKVWKVEREQNANGSAASGDSKEIVDLFRYFVDTPASYRVTIQARDLNREGVVDSVETEIYCDMFEQSDVGVSDVELASEISRVDKNTSKVFAKHNYAVVPHPRQVYGEGLSNLYYYFESYNLEEYVPGEKYQRLAYLKDMSGEPVEGIGAFPRTRTKQHDTSVEIGMIGVSQVPTGMYTLVYGIADTGGTELRTKEKSVFIYNPSLIGSGAEGTVATGSAVLSALEGLSEEELDREYEYLRYLTKQEERNFYKNLDNVNAKSRYIVSVWQEKANSEGMVAEDFRRQYLQRVEHTNSQFRATGGEGWKTDQGRVYILYGPPTDVQRIASSPSNRPYQIWVYDSLRGQGGVQFIFVDRFGFRRYELVHSTLRGELQDPNWERFVEIGN